MGELHLLTTSYTLTLSKTAGRVDLMSHLIKYVFVGVLLITGCDTASVEDLPEADVDQMLIIPEDWVGFEPDSIFQFMGPPDLIDQEAVGIDSFVEIYRGDRIVVSFNYDYAIPPNETCWEGFVSCRLERPIIDDEPSRLFTTQLIARDQSFGEIEYTVSVEFDNLNGNNSLFLNASSYDAQDTTSLRLIAQSIDFIP